MILKQTYYEIVGFLRVVYLYKGRVLWQTIFPVFKGLYLKRNRTFWNVNTSENEVGDIVSL